MDRSRTFVPAVRPPEPAPERALVFAFRGAEVVVDTAGAIPSLDVLSGGLRARQFLGWLDDVACYAAWLDDEHELPEEHATLDLRALFQAVDERHWALAGRAAQLLAWERDHAFCGRCGAPTRPVPGERALGCASCGLHAYPRLSPAVIMLVEREGRALLGRNAAFPRAWFSCLAGFVEPGETLEEAVAREVREEAGIEIRDITYVASQPWPFPHSLMIGFTARWAAGELRFDPAEIADGGWFAPDDLPLVPPPPSIASRLIRDWLERSTRRR